MIKQSLWGASEYKINKPVRLIELFAGIGSQAMALRDLGVNFDLTGPLKMVHRSTISIIVSERGLIDE